MPRTKTKTINKTLFCYVSPSNNSFVRTMAKKNNVSYSTVIDSLITSWRKQIKGTTTRKRANV